MSKKQESAAIKPTCKDCYFASLVQYDNDPLLAECAMKDKEERMPASVTHSCCLYTQQYHPKQITHRKKSHT